eukprot:543133-Pleurochrysis_carterae.AAC.1
MCKEAWSVSPPDSRRSESFMASTLSTAADRSLFRQARMYPRRFYYSPEPPAKTLDNKIYRARL